MTQEIFINYSLKFGVAILLVVIGLVLASLAGKVTAKSLGKVDRLDAGLRLLAVKLVRMLILIIAGYAALSHLNVDLTLFLAVAGAAGLAIGLAMQGTLSNLAAGVMILLFRHFKVGEVIQISGNVLIIDEIGIFMTTAHQPDGPYVTVPNNQLWGQSLTNFSRTFEDRRRLNETIGISYGDDMEKAKAIVVGIIANEPRFLKEPAPMVAVTNLGDSSVDLVVHAWTKRADWFPTRLWFIQKVKEEFDAQGISIPFPQRDVHLFQSANDR